MSLPACHLCSESRPGMVALMTVQYGRFVGLPPEPGYFYLCPRCFEEKVKPHEPPLGSAA